MTEAIVVHARPRVLVGKANRRLSADGVIPAVLYGAGREAQTLSVDRHDFEQMVVHKGTAHLLKLHIEGEKDGVNAVIKSMQRDAVKGVIQHIDFLAVRMDRPIQASVPLMYLNEDVCVGVKAGGVLMHSMREVTVEALPRDLPEGIEVDVSALEIGVSVHVGALVAPAGVTIVGDSEGIVCSVTAPTVEPEVEEEVAEEVAEPELIGEAPEEE